jgi:hypothetical protein
MANMSDYLKQLEAHEDLEAEVIKKTKVHKVLKAIIKLNSIPKEEEYAFKQRSNDLLTKWGGALAADPEPTATTPAEPATNGVKHDEDEKSEPAKEDSPAGKKEIEEDTPAQLATTTKPADADIDVSMADADKEVNKEVPAVKADAESSIEGSTGGAVNTDTVIAPSDIAT